MRHLFSFLVLAAVKTLSSILFKCDVTWITKAPADPWTKDIRLAVFLNHTSLYEPVFLQAVTYRYLWELSARANVPAADITLNRPIVGFFWKLMIPNIHSVNRKNDGSWENYVRSIQHDDVVMIAPEGRMKRPNGLDKYGKKMTVRGGVADIIISMNDGKMLLAFSGGLHHVQAPGQHVPNFFRKIKLNIAYIDIAEYKKSFPTDPRAMKLAIVQDLQHRLENDCPSMNISKSSLHEERTGT